MRHFLLQLFNWAELSSVFSDIQGLIHGRLAKLFIHSLRRNGSSHALGIIRKSRKVVTKYLISLCKQNTCSYRYILFDVTPFAFVCCGLKNAAIIVQKNYFGRMI